MAGQVINDPSIEIGGLFSLTSYGSTWGTAEMKAVQLAIDERNSAGGINGRNINLVVEDAKTSGKDTVTAYTKLTQVDGVKYIIGSTWEESTSAITPLAKEDGIVLISPSSYFGIQEAETNHLFSTYPPYEYQIHGLLPYINKHNITTFAVVYSAEFFSTTMNGLFKQVAEEQGWTIVETFVQDMSDHDMSTIVTQLKTLDIDGVYVPFAGNDVTGLFQTEMVKQDVQIPVLGITSMEDAAAVEKYGSVMNGIIYPMPIDSPGYEFFAQKYEMKYGVLPESPSAATAYDAANLLFDALESGQDVATYLHEVEYDGASNKIVFDEFGVIAEKEYVVKQITNEEFVFLD
jgi:ABC-type branched-subunit amino acid transport system substrate-binding protein